MILGDIAIKAEIEEGGLVIMPFDKNRLQAGSYDLSLGGVFYVPMVPEDTRYIDPLSCFPSYTKHMTSVILPPHGFCLGVTAEYVEFVSSELMGFVHGKSTVGRWGITVHTAGLIDSGFRGHLTLELYNHNNFAILLTESMKIAQMTVHLLDGCHKQYSSAYYCNNDETPITPKLIETIF